MTKDRKVLLSVSVSFLVILFLALFLPVKSSRVWAALILVPAALIAYFVIKKRSILSINKRQVLLLMIVIGALWVTLLYLSGIHFGFSRTGTPFGAQVAFLYILPITLSIISIEIIRGILRAQEDKTVDIICYFMCIVADVLIASNLHSITSFNKFMDVVGLTLLPAVTANLLYHFISKRFGALPVISYRLIIALYPMLFSIVPITPDAIVSLGNLILPLLVYAFISALFEKKKRTHKKTSVVSYISIGAACAVMISIVMIISCQFSIGALVIGSASMTGELNTGDVAIYERYEDQIVQEGDVLVFSVGNSRIIHRVIDIEYTDSGARYFTKGDANDEADIGFITDEDIIGVVSFKIAYVGYPTVWLRDLFSR